MPAFKGMTKKGKGLCGDYLCKRVALVGKPQGGQRWSGRMKSPGMAAAAARHAGWSGSMQQSMEHHEPPLSWRATQASSSLLGQPPAEFMSGRAARQAFSMRRHGSCVAGACRAHQAGLSTFASSRAQAVAGHTCSIRLQRAMTVSMQRAQGHGPAPECLILCATV